MTDETELDAKQPSDASKAGARVGHRWQPGESGNRRGRRPETEVKPVRDLARRYTTSAVRRLAQLIRSSNERVAAYACVALLDRGWGRPAQALTGPDGAPLNLVVGLMSGSIDSAERAVDAYRAIIGDPTINLSAITFAPQKQPHEVQQSHVEAAQDPIEAEPVHGYQTMHAPDLEHLEAPGKVIQFNWERLGK